MIIIFRCGSHLNCLAWSPDCGSVYCGGGAGSVVKVAMVE